MDTLRNRAEQCTTLTQYTEIRSLCKTGLFKAEKTLWDVDTAPPPIVFVVREGDNSDYWRWMAIQAVLLQEAYTHT